MQMSARRLNIVALRGQGEYFFSIVEQYEKQFTLTPFHYDLFTMLTPYHYGLAPKCLTTQCPWWTEHGEVVDDVLEYLESNSKPGFFDFGWEVCGELFETRVTEPTVVENKYGDYVSDRGGIEYRAIVGYKWRRKETVVSCGERGFCAKYEAELNRMRS